MAAARSASSRKTTRRSNPRTIVWCRGSGHPGGLGEAWRRRGKRNVHNMATSRITSRVNWVARRFLSPGQQPIYLDGRRKLEYP